MLFTVDGSHGISMTWWTGGPYGRHLVGIAEAPHQAAETLGPVLVTPIHKDPLGSGSSLSLIHWSLGNHLI
jgi:hypothetical protein